MKIGLRVALLLILVGCTVVVGLRVRAHRAGPRPNPELEGRLERIESLLPPDRIDAIERSIERLERLRGRSAGLGGDASHR